jgi:hypothetical protein
MSAFRPEVQTCEAFRETSVASYVSSRMREKGIRMPVSYETSYICIKNALQR